MVVSAADRSAWEVCLSQHVFLSGDVPGSRDVQVFEELDTQVPSCATHPYLYAWYVLMSFFSTKVKEHWSTLPKSAAPQEAADYDIDLFSDDPQMEEAWNLEVSKYSVGFEIKPVSFSVNLDELAQKIMTLVAKA